MYADDTVVFVHANSADQAAVQLTNSMLKITEWLKHNCLQLNLSKTVCMFFSKSKSCCAEPDVAIDGQRLQVSSDFKYLGVYIDSNLTFRSHIKKLCNNIKFNLPNFRYARSCMSIKAANMFMHSMIFSHITYCLTTWSQASNTSLKPILSLYKQALKVLDKKSIHHHHCDI